MKFSIFKWHLKYLQLLSIKTIIIFPASILWKRTYMKKPFVLTGFMGLVLAVSSANSTVNCPVDAPQFTTDIGLAAIKQWGKNAYENSPRGHEGFSASNVGAAYFTLTSYAPDAVLLPTVSSVSRVGFQGIYDYFVSFLKENPVMSKVPFKGGTTLAGCGVGVISGYYNFELKKADEPPKEVHARYTMQFEYSPRPREVSLKLMGDSGFQKVITYTQPVGWYIKLQNSAVLPAEHEEFDSKE